MNEWIFPVTGTIALVVAFLSALWCHGLRDFSYSRLEEICRKIEQPDRFSLILKSYDSAILAVHVLLSLSLSAVAGLFSAWLWFGTANQGSAAILAVEWIPLLFGICLATVVVPWSLARVAGESVIAVTWPLLSAVASVLHPLVWLAVSLDRYTHRLVGRKEPGEADSSAISREIRTVVEEGQREGLIEQGARRMIDRVMELHEEDVAAIMTQRTEMICLPAESTLEQARLRLIEVGHSRVPVIGDSTDDILGVVYAKDLLGAFDPTSEDSNAQHRPVTAIMREPYFMPESTSIGTMLEGMRNEHVQLAIVVDEYGGVSGLVTMEDILEEIVGDIVDEYDKEEDTLYLKALTPNSVEVDARYHIDDLNEQFQLELPEDDDYDTIGGLVVSKLGHIPANGEFVDLDKLKIVVTEANKRKVIRLRIEGDNLPNHDDAETQQAASVDP